MRHSILVATAVLALALVADHARAGSPHIHFSFGAVHGWHHHHCHPWPRSYVFEYAPRPVYVYQPAIVQPAVPQYVAPAYTPAPQTPNWTSRSEPRTNALPASRTITSAVTIRNPAASGGAVAFVIDEAREVTLSAGQTQTLNDAESYVVEFDRGGDYGVARKKLSSGAYEFTVTDRGWDLVEAGRVAAKPSVRKNDLPTLR